MTPAEITEARNLAATCEYQPCEQLADTIERLADALERASEGDPDFRAIAVERDNDLTQVTAERDAAIASAAAMKEVLLWARREARGRLPDRFTAACEDTAGAELLARLERAEQERDAAIASAAALREALELARQYVEPFDVDKVDAALADNAGAALLERLRAAESDILVKSMMISGLSDGVTRHLASLEAETKEKWAERKRAQAAKAENARLAAQLLLDGPMAAAGRVFVKIHDALIHAEELGLECEAGFSGYDDEREALKVLTDLAREQKGGT